MCFDSIVPVHKSDQFCLAVISVFKSCFVVPHIHEGSDDTFCFSVGLRTFYSSEFLFDSVLRADLHKGMVGRITAIFGAVV